MKDELLYFLTVYLPEFKDEINIWYLLESRREILMKRMLANFLVKDVLTVILAYQPTDLYSHRDICAHIPQSIGTYSMLEIIEIMNKLNLWSTYHRQYEAMIGHRKKQYTQYAQIQHSYPYASYYANYIYGLYYPQCYHDTKRITTKQETTRQEVEKKMFDKVQPKRKQYVH